MNKVSIRCGLWLLVSAFSLLSVYSCAHKSGHHGRERVGQIEPSAERPIDDRGTASRPVARRTGEHTTVKMRKENGVYLVPIEVNGLNLDFVFDTGASSISISLAEARVMARQGKITEDDILGQARFADANGDVSVGMVIQLRTVKIGDIVLENVKATVVDNLQAPLLLGQTALAKFGKVTIDYEHDTIEFN